MTLELQQYPMIREGFAAGGLNLKSAVTSLEDNESPFCKNVSFGRIFGIESRKGFSKIAELDASPVTGIYQLSLSSGTDFNLAISGPDLYTVAVGPPVVINNIYSGFTPGEYQDFATLNDYAFIVDGVDPNIKTEGVNIYELGVPAPVAALGFVGFAAAVPPHTGLTNGATYQYRYTWVNLDGEESNPSPAFTIPAPGIGQGANLNNISVSPAPAIGAQQIVGRNIYRTEANGNTFYLINTTPGVPTIPDNITTIFFDDFQDSLLGAELEFDNDIPPILSMIETHKDRLFGVDPTFPSNLLFSKQYRHDQWPTLNSIPVGLNDGDAITAIVSFFDQLVIFKRRAIYVLSGDDNINFTLQKVQTDDRVGALNNRVPSVLDNKVMFLSERGVFSFDGLRIKYESQKIEPFFDTARPFDVFTFNWQFESIACAINYSNSTRSWYFLAVPTGITAENNLVLVFDNVINQWTFFDGINANCLGIIEEGNKPRLWSGDLSNFLWRQDDTDNDGYVHTASYSTTNFNGVNTLQDDTLAEIISTATATGAATLTDATLLGVVANQYVGQQIYINTGAATGEVRTILANTATPVTFTVAAWGIVPAPGDEYIVGGLNVFTNSNPVGVRVKIVDGLGEDQIRTIIANTPTVITVDSNWTTIPDTTSRYSIGFIEKEYQTKWVNYNDPDRWKRLLYEHFNTSKSNELGSILETTTFFDFSAGATGTFFTSDISLAGADSLWDVAIWDVNFWDFIPYIVTRVRAESGHIHRYVQIKLYNDVGNEPFTVNSLGLQWQLKGYR